MDVGPVNIYEYESLAKEKLAKEEYDFIAGGATDEITLRRTREVFDAIMLRPRMLTDISSRDLSTQVLGQHIDFPVMIDPAGGHGRAHPEGELATVRAAGKAGTLMIMSISSTKMMEEVAAQASGPIWFQQYLYRDRNLTAQFAHRAEEAGFTALCVTVDTRAGTKRERNLRNDYKGSLSPHYASVGLTGQDQIKNLMDLGHAWDQLGWLAESIDLPLVVKGIMTAEDARLCVDHGAKAVIVSSHGSRQLDTTLATIEVLPEVVDEVGPEIDVYLDGGIRRGTDVLKALALGARAVLIGRPLFWGLAVDGEAGLVAVLHMLRDELDSAMGMCGRSSIARLDRDLLSLRSPLSTLLR
ncbi:alpha-hydroxy-acid oxidizing protein [Dehalococcoidia bacterium]|nr:alpha-hydroxy-acid oxidizing protein [Dehalococcoidia bacterium]